MSDTWTHILNALSPDYEKCVTAVLEGPKYRCTLNQQGKYHVVTLSEFWHVEKEIIPTNGYHTSTFDDHISWIDEQLSKWQDVKRMSWDQWHFKYKKDAEKFITLFNIKWAK